MFQGKARSYEPRAHSSHEPRAHRAMSARLMAASELYQLTFYLKTKTAMKIFLSSLGFILLVITVNAQQVISDANAQQRNISSFHAIKVSHAIDLYISQGNEEGVAVSAKNDEYRDKIKTAVENGVLKIWYDEDSKFWKNSGSKNLKAYISFKTLNNLTASGASDVQFVSKIKVNDLTINLGGASDLKGFVEASSLKIDLSGASDMTISGSASNLTIEASGASDFKGFDLQTENCTVKANGASSVKITVSKEINAQASGASEVHFRGSGVIKDLKTSGASNVSKRG